jgi:LuxR family maltose regulon positive regulatory protein
VLAYLALVDLDAGDLASARRHAGASRELLEAHGLAGSYVATNTYIALAGIHAADADARSELAELEQAVRLSEPARPSLWHAHALLRLASTRHKLGDAEGAREALESARDDLETLPDPGMLGALGAKVAAELSAPPRHEGYYGQPLSEAELRVLALLAAGDSISDVARELYLAPTTVKTHRRTIYRKLGATTRQEAIARATALGIAEAPRARQLIQDEAGP